MREIASMTSWSFPSTSMRSVTYASLSESTLEVKSNGRADGSRTCMRTTGLSKMPRSNFFPLQRLNWIGRLWLRRIPSTQVSIPEFTNQFSNFPSFGSMSLIFHFPQPGCLPVRWCGHSWTGPNTYGNIRSLVFDREHTCEHARRTQKRVSAYERIRRADESPTVLFSLLAVCVRSSRLARYTLGGTPAPLRRGRPHFTSERNPKSPDLWNLTCLFA
jgi:hypothetical protein